MTDRPEKRRTPLEDRILADWVNNFTAEGHTLQSFAQKHRISIFRAMSYSTAAAVKTGHIKEDVALERQDAATIILIEYL